MDIKNTLEVLKAAEVAGEQLAAALEDGKLGLTDLPKLVKMFGPLKDAVQDLALIPAEIKDIDGEELGQVVNAVTALANAWLPVFNAKVS